MVARLDLYTATGLTTGTLWPRGRLAPRVEQATALELDEAAWAPLYGPDVRAKGRVSIAVDDVLLAFDPNEEEATIHATWHPVLLDVGPYEVRGELATQPGFDPGRALTRPSGSFLHLRDARIERRERPDLMARDHPSLLVNRYTVDKVRAGIMLGFFFPGAQIEEFADVEPVAHE